MDNNEKAKNRVGMKMFLICCFTFATKFVGCEKQKKIIV